MIIDYLPYTIIYTYWSLPSYAVESEYKKNDPRLKVHLDVEVA